MPCSFHGIPQRFVDRGDPYASHCEATARSLAARAGWETGTCLISYQSRAGREPWLLPVYTDETLAGLARTGVRHVMVMCPGFVADCLETVEEPKSGTSGWSSSGLPGARHCSSWRGSTIGRAGLPP